MTTSDPLAALIALETDVLECYCEHIAIEGTIAQFASLRLRKGQSLWASKGTLLGYDGVDWQLRVPGGAAKALGRVLSGEGITLTHVTATRDGATVHLTANQPGRLATWDLSRGPIVCTQGAFVGALGDVDIDVTMARSAGAALFGGAGLFLQKLSGEGVVLVHGSGDFVPIQLAAGERLLVSTGNLAVFSGEVGYGIQRTGGFFKSLFGGEGLFMTELTGPGWVMLQSLKKVRASGSDRGSS